MTKRAVIIGLIMAAMIAGFTYINNYVIKQSDMIANFMPICVYGVMVLTLITINPLLSLICKNARLKGREYAVIMAIALVACSVPASGLMRFFPNAMMLPHRWEKGKVAWRSESALQMVPGYMIAGSPPDFVVGDFEKPVELCAALAEESKAGTFSAPRKQVWKQMPAEKRQDIISAATGAKEQAAAALVNGFNSVLSLPKLYEATAFADMTIVGKSRQILYYLGTGRGTKITGPGAVTRLLSQPGVREEHIRTFNRLIIDWAWPNEIYGHEKRLSTELGAYMRGSQGSKGAVPLSEVPWAAWRRPLLFWLPLFIVTSIGIICLSLIVHKQWSQHESLPYPLVRFTTSMLPDNDGNNAIFFKHPGFWWALGIVFAIFMLNYLSSIFPNRLPSLPLTFDFSALQTLYAPLNTGLARWMVFTVRVLPLVIGVAYMVRSDVALSVGLAPPVSLIVMSILGTYGISTNIKGGTGGLYSGNPRQLFIAGAALAFTGQILYTGRTYYKAVLKRALFLKSEDEVENGVVAAARLLSLCAAVMVAYLMSVGVDWLLAVLYTLLAFMLFMVMSRVVSETGIFVHMANWYPCAALLGLFGLHALGPGVAILMFMTSTVLLVQPRNHLMPFAVGALKLIDAEKVKSTRMAPWLIASVILAIAIAVPVTLAYTYGTGAPGDGWSMAVSRYSFRKAVHIKKKLRAQGRLEQVNSIRGISRIAHFSPHPKTISLFFVGAIVVVLLSFARIRWRWWPLHPVFGMLFFSGPVFLWHSFMIGWLVRKLVVKYGGQKAYARTMPVVMGLIAGNLLGLLVPNLIGIIYYFASGGDRLPVAPPMFDS